MLTVNYFAAAKAARGAETDELDTSGLGTDREPTVGDVLDHLGAVHTQGRAAGNTLAQVFGRCTFLLDGTSSRRDAPVASARQLDIMPPFAGG